MPDLLPKITHPTFTIFGMPDEGQLRRMHERGWTYEPWEISPGLFVARARHLGERWIYHWPGTEAEFGCWRYSPPDEYRVRTSIPYRLAGGPKPSPRMAPRIVYLTGYGNRPVGDLFESIKSVRGWLVDIRHWPHSKLREEFDRSALRSLFQSRYTHLPELGNTAKSNPAGIGDIRIADMDGGIARIDQMLKNGRTPVVLMCACGRPDGCHRSVVGAEMMSRGFTVKELDWTQSDKNGQSTHRNANAEPALQAH
ncbi:MAG: DUF488 domain-containing protein [Capsulimonadales bacterium]|nr:DUF488 domain-containing protein [Capsulimonadales bacterium]